MQITKPTKAEVTRELKDYIFITLGLISYALGWAAFLIPYQITTGGTTGIGAIIYYATGFPIQWSYFIINAAPIRQAMKSCPSPSSWGGTPSEPFTSNWKNHKKKVSPKMANVVLILNFGPSILMAKVISTALMMK